jgi:hypothetical protein
MTELNPHDTYEPWDANQPPWMKLAVTMHNVFTYEMANTYMVWSSIYGLVDRFTGLPNNSNYYALAQFSRFVNADDWRVAATSNDPAVLVTHYRNDAGPGITDRQILVIINTASSPKHATIGTSSIWASDPVERSWQVFQTANDGSATKRATRTEIDQGPSLGGDRLLVLPPHSITTALINNGSLASPYSQQEVWRFGHFNTFQSTGIAADTADPDSDGENNLLEFATGQDPYAATLAYSSVTTLGTNLEFTYHRNKEAVIDGFSFIVEWSDDLSTNPWSTAGVVETTSDQTATIETRKATIPAASEGKRFVRLKIRK